MFSHKWQYGISKEMYEDFNLFLEEEKSKLSSMFEQKEKSVMRRLCRALADFCQCCETRVESVKCIGNTT
ncbi:MAG: hypothetical protein ACTJLM_05480 [Ehrlichia sp.]